MLPIHCTSSLNSSLTLGGPVASWDMSSILDSKVPGMSFPAPSSLTSNELKVI
jgi:hypothetical protein